MNDSGKQDDYVPTQQYAIETAVKLGALFLLIALCFTILRPFALILAWGVIVAIALYPLFERLAKITGGRTTLSATLLSLLLVALLALPTLSLTDSLIEGAQYLAAAGDNGEPSIPPPPESVADWPLIGKKIYGTWERAAVNLPQVLEEFTPQIRALGSWALQTVTGTGLTVLQFIASFIIAGVILAKADASVRASKALVDRLTGGKGAEIAELTTVTVRNVALGIVGVAVVQTALLALGFVVMDIPGAGLLALLTLILCIVGVGPTLVAVPAIIYVFSTSDGLPATLFAIWTLVWMVSDNVMKPLVFGRGAKVPTGVIFIGAIGGMLAYGIIGLFIGAIVLSLGYKFYEVWLTQEPIPSSPAPEE
jgi:predicted PurR-regulated permease PerM